MTRKAKYTDKDFVISCACRFHDEFLHSFIKLDESIMEQRFNFLFENAVIFVNDAGISIGIVFDSLFSNDKMMQEICWYVLPEKRNTKKSIELIQALEEEARVLGCARLIMTSVNGKYFETVSKFYEHKKMRLMEKNFIKELV